MSTQRKSSSDWFSKYCKARVTRTSGDRKNSSYAKIGHSRCSHNVRVRWSIRELSLRLRSLYETIRDMRSWVTRSLLYVKISSPDAGLFKCWTGACSVELTTRATMQMWIWCWFESEWSLHTRPCIYRIVKVLKIPSVFEYILFIWHIQNCTSLRFVWRQVAERLVTPLRPVGFRM